MGLWVRVAIGLTALGLAAHILGVVSRGLAVHRVPWGDMYEFVTTVTCVAVVFFFVIMLRYRAYRLGLFVLGPVVILLGLAETVIYTPAGQLPPALQSYWLAIHVTSITLATGAYVVAALLAVVYLLAERHGRRVAAGLPTRGDAIFRILPVPKVIDQLAYRTVVFGFPLWTFGIIAGRDLGGRGLGPVLGLGSHRDLGLHHLGGVRGLPARPRDRGLARPQVRLHPADRVRVPALQHHRGQHPHQGTALVRRAQLIRRLSGAPGARAAGQAGLAGILAPDEPLQRANELRIVFRPGSVAAGCVLVRPDHCPQAVRLQPSVPARRVTPQRRLRVPLVPGQAPGPRHRTAGQPPHPRAADQQPHDEQGGQDSQQHHGRSLTSVVPRRRQIGDYCRLTGGRQNVTVSHRR